MIKIQIQRSHLSPVLTLICIAILIAGCGGTSGNSTNQGSSPTPQKTPVQVYPSLKDLYNILPRIHVFQLSDVGISNFSVQSPLTYHRGNVMRSISTTYAIFWEPARLPDGTPTHVSPAYNSLIERYFKDVGGSGLYNINTQYFDLAGRIANSSTFGGAWVDSSPYPASQCRSSYTPHGCLLDSQIQAEVTKAMRENKWAASPSHLFFVYTSWGEGSCADSTSTYCSFSIYCAYHSYYTIAHQDVLYANMPYTGTRPRDCGVQASPNNNIDADSTINVTSHEHMEAVTDPYINAWYDLAYNEIGDKCAWTFGKLSLDGGKANVEWNRHYYIVQQEWSDAHLNCTLNV